jgi:hypothetical protein
MDISADVPIASMTPEQLDATIGAVQADLSREALDPRRPEKHARLVELYKARWGTEDVEPRVAMDPPPVALAAPEAGFDLRIPSMPSEAAVRGFSYDRDALAELGPVVAAAGIPVDEIRMWAQAGHGLLGSGPRTGERAPVGEDVVSDGQLRDARAVLDRLSPSTRAAVERWLEATGLHSNPGFILWLAQYAKPGGR